MNPILVILFLIVGMLAFLGLFWLLKELAVALGYPARQHPAESSFDNEDWGKE